MLIGITCALYVLLAGLLVICVLMQKGKGFGAESSRGSGFSGTYFGSSGAESFMKKVTIGLAAALMGGGVFLGALFQSEALKRTLSMETPEGDDHDETFENFESGAKASGVSGSELGARLETEPSSPEKATLNADTQLSPGEEPKTD